jgi:hypothetical protein
MWLSRIAVGLVVEVARNIKPEKGFQSWKKKLRWKISQVKKGGLAAAV